MNPQKNKVDLHKELKLDLVCTSEIRSKYPQLLLLPNNIIPCFQSQNANVGTPHKTTGHGVVPKTTSCPKKNTSGTTQSPAGMIPTLNLCLFPYLLGGKRLKKRAPFTSSFTSASRPQAFRGGTRRVAPWAVQKSPAPMPGKRCGWIGCEDRPKKRIYQKVLKSRIHGFTLTFGIPAW